MKGKTKTTEHTSMMHTMLSVETKRSFFYSTARISPGT